ncbi:hypothetical protein [Solitalea lacus]|uniref:hypothetical protein n=1 Tax=Solitalea lacus TaxID=2911172 RepID=UPI001EDAB17E|nr:hypothetical protein [Solitalea lacus]UKJ06560.1 hypothetical protein L2B55_13600 [Solitalea lacus]
MKYTKLKSTSFNDKSLNKVNVCECVRKASGLPCGVPEVRTPMTPSTSIPLPRYLRITRTCTLLE